jgi:CRP/FNR family transcriptional regulator, cyclic AMP receptor protein
MTTSDAVVGALRRARFFASAPHDQLEQMAGALTPQHAAPGERILVQGDRGDSMFLILSGRVLVHSGELAYNELAAGDVFGEMAALDPAPRSASVTALEPTDMLRLDQPALYGLIDRHPAVARGVINVLCRHLRNRVSDMEENYEYMRVFGMVTGAALALERGSYTPQMIDEVAARTDELGDLGRVFQQMAREVAAREQQLRRQIQELRIEVDRTRQQRQVAEITGSSYFQRLQQQASQLRESLRDDIAEG